jgi:hypothetical protein
MPWPARLSTAPTWPEQPKGSVETSLTRLGLDHLDVVYVHGPPAAILSRVLADDGAPFLETGDCAAAVVSDAFSLIGQVARERILPAAGAVVPTTAPSLRSSDQATANVAPMAPAGSRFRQALSPLAADFKTAIPPD